MAVKYEHLTPVTGTLHPTDLQVAIARNKENRI